MNNFIYVLGAISLATGCIYSKFKKTVITGLLELVGFVLMIVAFI